MGVGGVGSSTGLPGMQRFSPSAPSLGYLPCAVVGGPCAARPPAAPQERLRRNHPAFGRWRGMGRPSASGSLQSSICVNRPGFRPGWPRPSPGRRTPRGRRPVQGGRRPVRPARCATVRRRGCGPGRPGVLQRSAEGGGPDPQLDRQDFAGAYTQCNTRVTCSRMGRPEGMEDAKSMPVRRSEPAARGSGIGLRGGAGRGFVRYSEPAGRKKGGTLSRPAHHLHAMRLY